MTEKDYQRKKNKWLAKIHTWYFTFFSSLSMNHLLGMKLIELQTCGCRVQAHGGGVMIPFSGVLEQKLADMPADEAQVYCKENDLTRCASTIYLSSSLTVWCLIYANADMSVISTVPCPKSSRRVSLLSIWSISSRPVRTRYLYSSIPLRQVDIRPYFAVQCLHFKKLYCRLSAGRSVSSQRLHKLPVLSIPTSNGDSFVPRY